MNRLIIIGNGFDLAHERETRYHDFFRILKKIIKICINSSYRQYDIKEYRRVDGLYEEELVQIKLKQRFSNIKYEGLINKISTISEWQEVKISRVLCD